MSAYLDTSVLVALFFHEATSEQARKRAARESLLWVSRWTLAEFASATAFKQRSSQADAATSGAALDRLRRIVAEEGLHVAEVERDDIERAGALCEDPASRLRTPDALHAAIAARMRVPLITSDRTQAHGCVHHRIAVELLGEASAPLR